MSKSIQNIWILQNNGIILFNRVLDENLDNILFGNLVAAMHSFSKELAEGDLSNFEISNKRFTIKKEKELLFIANSSKKTDDKKTKKDLEKISEKFFQSYPKNITDFENEIGDLLENPMKTFWNGF
ncbi:unnamed protein product [marine sediment metagenome]|uniref:FUZ/MON1/HPS1 first Longin domain-containing protein n=1 Tax=marine sediment metagenome TaxID=412755 RepID=X1EI17_9ZZZZ